MLLNKSWGSVGNILRVRMVNTAGAPLTGLGANAGGFVTTAGLNISSIADPESAPIIYTAVANHIQTIAVLGTFAAPSANCCRLAEVDATNLPGLYEIQLADARYAVANASQLIAGWTGAANLQTDAALIDLTFAGIGVNFVGAVLQNGIVDAGTAQAAGNATLQIRAAAGFADNTLVGMTVQVLGSTQGYPQTRQITAYVAATKTLSVDAWGVTPTGTISYAIFATAPGSVASAFPVNAVQLAGSAPAATALANALTGIGGTVLTASLAGNITGNIAGSVGQVVSRVQANVQTVNNTVINGNGQPGSPFGP